MTRILAFSLVLFAGCGSKAKSTVAPALPHRPVATEQPQRAAPAPVTRHTPGVGVSDALAARCKLHFAATRDAPNFDTDAAELLPADRALLEQVATCLVTGPLKGRHVQLVGRTDPRGTDEYNLALGTRRAETVRGYLQRLGVQPAQLASTTRGELDARGQDDVSWRDDRRVDLHLAEERTR